MKININFHHEREDFIIRFPRQDNFLKKEFTAALRGLYFN